MRFTDHHKTLAEDRILAFDTLFTTNQIQKFKILLPYLDNQMQKKMAIFIKFMELQYAISYFQNHPYQLCGCFTRETSVNLHSLCSALSAYTNRRERRQMEQFINIYQTMETYREFSHTFEMMKDFMPDMNTFGDFFGMGSDLNAAGEDTVSNTDNCGGEDSNSYNAYINNERSPANDNNTETHNNKENIINSNNSPKDPNESNIVKMFHEADHAENHNETNNTENHNETDNADIRNETNNADIRNETDNANNRNETDNANNRNETDNANNRNETDNAEKSNNTGTNSDSGNSTDTMGGGNMMKMLLSMLTPEQMHMFEMFGGNQIE